SSEQRERGGDGPAIAVLGGYRAAGGSPVSAAGGPRLLAGPGGHRPVLGPSAPRPARGTPAPVLRRAGASAGGGRVGGGSAPIAGGIAAACRATGPASRRVTVLVRRQRLDQRGPVVPHRIDQRRHRVRRQSDRCGRGEQRVQAGTVCAGGVEPVAPPRPGGGPWHPGRGGPRPLPPPRAGGWPGAPPGRGGEHGAAP